jgi:hypothetical protein
MGLGPTMLAEDGSATRHGKGNRMQTNAKHNWNLQLLRRVAGALAVALSVLLTAGSSSAINIPLSALIDGPQANAGAGTGSLGTGTASLTFDTTTNLLSWNVGWTGLSGPVVAAHFHGPALPNQNAGVQVSIGVVSPDIGAAVLGAGQAADLLAGLWYVNLHTAAFPGGEIRGQIAVIPEPTTALLVGLGIMGLAVNARRQGRRV